MDAFYKRKGSKDGYRNECKKCISINNKKLRTRYSLLERDYSKEIYKKCRSCKEIKSSFLFTKTKYTKDGLSKICSQCSARDCKEYGKRNQIRFLDLDPDLSGDKYCPICDCVKPKYEFRINRKRPDGLHGTCKKCASIIEKQCRDNRKKLNKNKVASINNKKQCSRCETILPETNFDIRKDSVDGLNYLCKECSRNKAHTRRDLVVNSSASLIEEHEKVDRSFIMFLKETYNFCCGYCGIKPNVLHIDHIMPLSKGGRHIKSNLIPACKTCNSKKASKLPEIWFAEIGRLSK